MRTPLPLLIALVTGGAPAPQPGPLPDASPTQRGAVNTDPNQRLRGKTFVDKVTINADAGSAYVSTCVKRQADLGACPGGNGLQCVLDAGWFGCQPDGGWAQLGSGSGTATVSAVAPLQASGGTVSVDPAGTLNIQQVVLTFLDGGRMVLSGTGIANRFIATDNSTSTTLDGGAAFSCANNRAESSPCLANPIGPTEIGGYYNDSVSTANAAIYLGAMFDKLDGPVLTILNNYGQGGFERHLLDVNFDGDGVFGKWLHLGNTFSDSRIYADTGGLYLIADHPIYVYNRGSSEDVTQWFSGPGGTTVMTLGSTGGLQIETGPSRGTCTLNGASPSACNVTVLTNAVCGCFATGMTAAAGIPLAQNVVSTTLTCTGPNGSTATVNYICL